MRATLLSVLLVSSMFALTTRAIADPAGGRDACAPLQEPFHSFGERRVDAGPPLSLATAVDEALASNPTLVALRQQFDVARLRPS